MKNTKRKESMVVLLLVAVIALMTVGFAAYTRTLNINGTVTAKGSPWSVHFVHSGAATDIVETTGSVAASAKSVNDTDFTFTATLEKPGDFYEATVNVVNDGTINAVLKKITMSTLDTAQAKYLTYTVTYNGTAYTTTTDNLSVALNATDPDTTHPVKVRVEYKSDAAQNDLPSSDTSVTVTGSLDYQSAN